MINGMKLSKAEQEHFSSISVQEVLRGMVEAQIPLTSPYPNRSDYSGAAKRDQSPDTEYSALLLSNSTTYLVERTISECGLDLRAI
jgi:hypothetical protein